MTPQRFPRRSLACICSAPVAWIRLQYEQTLVLIVGSDRRVWLAGIGFIDQRSGGRHNAAEWHHLERPDQRAVYPDLDRKSSCRAVGGAVRHRNGMGRAAGAVFGGSGAAHRFCVSAYPQHRPSERLRELARWATESPEPLGKLDQ